MAHAHRFQRLRRVDSGEIFGLFGIFESNVATIVLLGDVTEPP